MIKRAIPSTVLARVETGGGADRTQDVWFLQRELSVFVLRAVVLVRNNSRFRRKSVYVERNKKYGRSVFDPVRLRLDILVTPVPSLSGTTTSVFCDLVCSVMNISP